MQRTAPGWAAVALTVAVVALMVAPLPVLGGAAPKGVGPVANTLGPAHSGGGRPSVVPSGWARASGSQPAHPMLAAAAVEHQIAAGQISPSSVFLPSSYTHLGPAPGNVVQPIVVTSPAPLGLVDYGVRSGGAYVYNTTSFEGVAQVDNYSAFTPGMPAFAESADWSALQLNTVAVNVTLPGGARGTFWVQNVVHLNGTDLQFEDNIWNFSSRGALLPANTIHSGSGQVYNGEFYFAYGPTYPVTFPFRLVLFNNITIVAGHPAVFLNYSFTNRSGMVSKSYDEVQFNSAASLSAPPQFQVNGTAYNPAGLLYDSELTWGGNGGGSNAVLQSVQANLSIASWVSGASKYRAVPSAYDFGVDTGETGTGAAAYYLGTTEFLTTGPSILYGLWNATTKGPTPAASAGWINVHLTVSPDYAFTFATNATAFALPLAAANLSYAPASTSGVVTTQLPPPPGGNPYQFAAWADGYQTGSLQVSSNATGTNTLALGSAPALLDAPVYLLSDAQVAAFGAALIPGTNFLASPATLWINSTSAALAAPFLRVNDFDYPEFMLFAESDLSDGIHLNALSQAASTFVYTKNGTPQSTSLPGWTQGYFFFGGSGAFSVGNVTITGNTTVYYSSHVTSPGAVQFYGTKNSAASNVSVAQDAEGILAIHVTGLVASTVTSATGSVGITAFNSSSVRSFGLTSTGLDEFGGPSWATYYANVSAESATQVSTLAGGWGVIAVNLTTWSIRDLFASGTLSLGFDVGYSTGGTLVGATATTDSSIGSASNITGLTVTGLTVTSAFGLDAFNAKSVSASNVTVSGSSSTGIDAFSNSTGGTFSNVTALLGSLGVYASNATHVVLSGLNATGGSAAALLSRVSDVTVTGLSAANQSAGLLWATGANGTLTAGTFGNSSVGVAAQNVTNLTVHGFNASESALAPPYFINPETFFQLPTAPVALANVSQATVVNVTADAYPFAVWANFTGNSKFENVTCYNGGTAFSGNFTSGDEIAGMFSFGNALGVELFNASKTTVTASTFEDSVAYGLVLENASNVTVVSNNFVANNNSSALGVYSGADLQVFVNNSTNIRFNTTVGNYWADHTGAGAYPILPEGIVDAKPVAAFIANWLEFVAHGLPAGTAWGVRLLSIPYTSPLAPLLYIPAGSLPRGVLSWSAEITPDYFARPSRGTVGFTGQNVTVNIFYTLAAYTITFSAAGLPSGTTWSVTFNGTLKSNTTSGTSGTIVFLALNSTGSGYAYSIGVVPGYAQSSIPNRGNITVSGSNVVEDLTFSAYTFAVTFTETGLPASTSWTVTVGASQQSTSTTSLVFREPNGTYSYQLTGVPGWTETSVAWSGQLTVYGAGVTKSLSFTITTFTVTFSEQGLGGGAGWSVQVNATAPSLDRFNSTRSSSGSTIVFSLPNGTFDFEISVGSGYTANTSLGVFNVTGHPTNLSVSFSGGKTSSPIWLYAAAGAGAAAVVVALALLLRRRRRTSSVPYESDAPLPPE